MKVHPIFLRGLKFNLYRTRIHDLRMHNFFGVKILDRYAFAQTALIDIDPVLKRAIDEHETQEHKGQHHQVFNLPKLLIEQAFREVSTVDCVVDDLLGKVQGEIIERERAKGDDQDQNLLS